MTFNPGSSGVEERNLFIPEEPNRVELDVEIEGDVLVAIYTMGDEDHGIGQLLRHQMQKDKRISFVAYTIPHPLEAKLKLRFHIHPSLDPITILNDNINLITENLGHLQSLFS
jgi:DNA-directed RNA polymerase II subunit RPB11